MLEPSKLGPVEIIAIFNALEKKLFNSKEISTMLSTLSEVDEERYDVYDVDVDVKIPLDVFNILCGGNWEGFSIKYFKAPVIQGKVLTTLLQIKKYIYQRA